MGPAADPRPEATRLGSYEILRKLARGGMAELFLARTNGPEGFEKLVVLKKILPNFAENPKFVRLFLDEAKLAATLDHPHIAHVYDMGKVEGNYFFTMEHVHGQDVRAMLRRTARLEHLFPLDHTVQIVHAIASALHYAHERRKPDGTLLDIVHRDVSPSNILVSYDGAIKLVDFGVAKAATSSVKTRTGTLKGKIAYMSPEQAKGSPVDRRSDIFSLGIVLWELITTQRLFRADNDLATIQMIINSKPQPPREIRPETPVELERIVLKALAPDPEQRYQTAEHFQLDLEEFAREEKLKQSTIAFKAHMHELFAEEIRAWKSAQASGMTLTDHIVSPSVVEMTTPVSNSEMSLLSGGSDVPPDDDDDDDDNDDDDDGLGGSTMRQPATHGQITRARSSITPAIAEVSPKVMLGRVDHTPAPNPDAPVAPLAMAGSGALRARASTPPPVAHPSGPHRMPAGTPSTLSGTPAPSTANALEGVQRSPFPIAPREWRESTQQPPFRPDATEARRKRGLVVGLLAVAVLALIALSTGGAPPSTRPEPAEIKNEPKAVDMHVEQPAPRPVVTAPPVVTLPTPTPTPTPKQTPPPTPRPAPIEAHRHAPPAPSATSATPATSPLPANKPGKKLEKPATRGDASGFLPPPT